MSKQSPARRSPSTCRRPVPPEQALQLPTVSDADRPGDDPPYDYPDYVGTRLRHPKSPLVVIPGTLSEATGPVYGESSIGELDHDLTKQYPGQPLGERIVVSGRVLGSDGKPLRSQLVEIWQAN